MSWFDTIKYCKIPEREREPFHPRRDPNNPQRPKPPGPYAEPFPDDERPQPAPPSRPKKPDDWKPPTRGEPFIKAGGWIESRQEALDAISKFLRRYRMELHGTSRHLGGSNFKIDANRLLKQLYKYIEYAGGD